MLEKLEKMGLIDSDNGQLGENEKIVLLHIYKSRLNGEKLDVDGVIDKIKQGKIENYSQLLSPELEQYFSNGFNDGIEKLHAQIAERRVDLGIENTFAAAKKFEEIEERMGHVCGAFNNKRQKLEQISSWLNDEEILSDMNLDQSGVKALQDEYAHLQSDYAIKRLQKLPLATRYILSNEIRLGKYNKTIEI